ncbi:hypothetical protein KY289_023216 [Solanum tuberosum]|nr:hypothetical protein KY289_023216 [Solanum tuberosum]
MKKVISFWHFVLLVKCNSDNSDLICISVVMLDINIHQAQIVQNLLCSPFQSEVLDGLVLKHDCDNLRASSRSVCSSPLRVHSWMDIEKDKLEHMWNAITKLVLHHHNVHPIFHITLECSCIND